MPRSVVAASVSCWLVLALGDPYAQVQAPAAATGGAPKLVVVLSVDQMRSDYLDRHASEFSSGLKRLMTEGAWFKESAYPYLGTVTCPGHATIGTGAFPYRHGLILNEWIDRQSGMAMGCTRDESTQILTYSPVAGTAAGESAKNLLVDTLADQIRERARGRIVTMSMKPRSAITLAGRKADAVVWFDDRGSWATSTAYTKKPVPFIEEFVTANPYTADVDKVWDRTLEAAKYQNDDDAAGERPPAGWTRVFPHPLATGGKADPVFSARWKASPFGDDYLARMAMAAADALKLGRGEGVDFLGVSFSVLDSVGHSFGPMSHEVQDVVFRLDRTIGRLLDHLDSTVGRGNYVVAFTSDHGVARIPEQVAGAGRHSNKELLAAVNAALVPLFGPGEYAVVGAYTDIYLAAGVAERLASDRRARDAALSALRALPGIEQAFMAEELRSADARKSPDPVKRAAALSYYAERSGDIVVSPRENWILSPAATTHGTHHPYDQRVPLLFYGAGVRPGVYSSAASPADVAPTLATLAHVRFKLLDGRTLSDAIASQSQ